MGDPDMTVGLNAYLEVWYRGQLVWDMYDEGGTVGRGNGKGKGVGGHG